MIQKCYYKKLVESESPEAKRVVSQNQQINFDYCRKYCSGYDLHRTCEKFKENMYSKLEKALR